MNDGTIRADTEGMKNVWTNFAKIFPQYAGGENFYGTDGNGGMVFYYVGNDKVDQVVLEMNTLGTDDPATPVEAVGAFGRTSLTDFINGAAPWGQTAKQFVVGTENISIAIYKENAADLDASIVNEILAEIEAVIASGPVIPETTEEVVENTEE